VCENCDAIVALRRHRRGAPAAIYRAPRLVHGLLVFRCQRWECQMPRPHRVFTTVALIAVLCGSGVADTTVMAAGIEPPMTDTAAPASDAVREASPPHLVIDVSRYTLEPESTVFAQRRGFWGRDRNEGPRTAIVLGTIATITGAALLVYANRPECG